MRAVHPSVTPASTHARRGGSLMRPSLLPAALCGALLLPLPIAAAAARSGARPTPRQLSFADQELSVFMHFGICTFADCEHNSGDASKFPPSLFAPTALDTDQVRPLCQSPRWL